MPTADKPVLLPVTEHKVMGTTELEKLELACYRLALREHQKVSTVDSTFARVFEELAAELEKLNAHR